MIIAFDLDGTLADLTHRLHFITDGKKDWDGFFAGCVKDKPIAPMIQLAGQLAIYNTIEIWSGRSDAVRPQTERWLKGHLGNWGSVLRMRKAGDHRPDDEVKGEWFDALKPEERPAIAFDDRQRVVDMWRSRGVICCQVAPGDF
jgi:hypothetical protein